MKSICQLYMPAFYRSYGKNAIKVVTCILENIKHAGFEGIYLISLFKDGGYDNGFDIIDYSVNPKFGTFEDFTMFIKIAHKLGLCVGVDIVPNHVSDKNIIALNCLNNVKGYENALYVVTKDEAIRYTAEGVPSFFGNLAYSDFGDKYIRTTFADYHQLNLNWSNEKVQEYFNQLFKRFKSLNIDFVRIDCGMMLHEDISKRDINNMMSCMNPEKSIDAIINVADNMPMFFEWFDPNSADLFNDKNNCYALDCSYVMTAVQSTSWYHPKLIPLVGGHDQMTLADRGLNYDEILKQMQLSEYGFLDMQTLINYTTNPNILPGDENYDADLKNPNQRYRARRPIAPVVEKFIQRY